MNPKLERKSFVACLIGLVVLATDRDLTDDAAALLGGVRVLRPRLVELDLLEGQIALKRLQYRDAIQVLRNVENSPTQWSMAKALMAWCQYMARDPDWEINVNDILLRSDAQPDAVAIAKRLRKGHKSKDTGIDTDDDTGHDDAASAMPAFSPDLSFAFMHLRA
jgi:type III secretion protein HrpB1